MFKVQIKICPIIKALFILELFELWTVDRSTLMTPQYQLSLWNLAQMKNKQSNKLLKK